MIALIAMVTIAELLLGEAAGSGEAPDPDTLPRLNISLRTPPLALPDANVKQGGSIDAAAPLTPSILVAMEIEHIHQIANRR
jgi:hypothetical protein